MELELNDMKEFKQVILEFDKDTIYKPSKICLELSKIYPELGNEIILPITMQNEEKGAPIFLFAQNNEFQIQGNFYNLIITLSEKSKLNLLEIIFNIFNVFNKETDIIGFACIFQEVMPQDKVIQFKENHFKNIDTINNDKIHFSMVREIEINSKKTRCLEGYSTLDKDFIAHFEFNMKKVDFEKTDYKYFLDFYNEAFDYKEGRKKCIV